MAIAFVTSAFGSTTTGTAAVAVTIATPGIGNALIAYCYIAAGVNATGVSSISGGGVTWVKAQANNVSSGTCEIWYGLNSSGSGTTVTITYGGTYGAKQAHVAEFSGLVTSGTATDGMGTNSGSNIGFNNIPASGTGHTATDITPSAGVDVLLVALFVTGSTITVDPASFTKLTTTTAGFCYYRIVTAPSGSYNASATFSSNYFATQTQLIAFKATGGGSSTFWQFAMIK